MFKVKCLPARFGDSIWVEYGDPANPSRILIDGGTAGTRHDIHQELKKLPENQRHFELIVVSHVDRDHIEGVLGMLEDAEVKLKIDDFWFNGWPHLKDDPDEVFGAVQGERLTEQILLHKLPWNDAFKRRAIVVPDGGPLPEHPLPGGMKITLLSPMRSALNDLIPEWEKEVRKANLDPGFGLEVHDEVIDEGDEAFGGDEIPIVENLAKSNFDPDDSEANGSSIAFLAEYEGKRALFAADAHAEALKAALDQFSPGKRVPLDLFKVSHHGSARTTDLDLIKKVDCAKYVFSTSGSSYGHPDDEAVSRVIVAGEKQPELIFNYKSKHNQKWDLTLLKDEYKYSARYPEEDDEGIVVEL